MKRAPLACLFLGAALAARSAAQQAEPKLSDLELELSRVYAEAKKYATPELEAEQRTWLQQPDGCKPGPRRDRCVAEHYLERIAELQARYALKRSHGPVHYVCPGRSNPVSLELTSYDTDPRTVIATRDGDRKILFYTETVTGTRWAVGKIMVWEFERTALVIWPDFGRQRCTLR